MSISTRGNEARQTARGPSPTSGRARFVALWVGSLLAAVSAVAGELHLRFTPRWGNEPLSVPSEARVTTEGQLVRITRLSGLISEIQLLRPEGSVVRLDGQFGFLDAATGRLDVALSAVPMGDYVGLQVRLGLPAAVNHTDPGHWAAGHPLNPQVNRLHWNWKGGYVFLAVEGFWRDASGAEESGFSYHLAADEQLMTVRFLSAFKVAEATEVELALDVSSLLKHRISSADGSDTTHSGVGDKLAPALARAAERSLFWLETKDTPRVTAVVAKNEKPKTGGTPHAFTVPAGFPQPELPADNPITEEGIMLGRGLFFDRRLSGNGRQSCADCHDPRLAFSDRVALSRGADGALGQRNAMPLFNLAWHPAYAWDSGKKTIRTQSLAAMTNPIEMHANLEEVVARLQKDARVVDGFDRAFGSPEVTAERLGRALEQFLLTQVSADSKFDRASRGEAQLTAQEAQGLALFLTEYDPVRGKRGGDCFHCHGGALFSDFANRSNGLDLVAMDAGAKAVTGRADDAGRMKTPSLRNVALTAPYMHDGRFKSLEEVVAHYDHGVQRAANLDPNLAKHPLKGMELSADDQAALVAFLRTLTDEEFLRPSRRNGPPPRAAMRPFGGPAPRGREGPPPREGFGPPPGFPPPMRTE